MNQYKINGCVLRLLFNWKTEAKSGKDKSGGAVGQTEREYEGKHKREHYIMSSSYQHI